MQRALFSTTIARSGAIIRKGARSSASALVAIAKIQAPEVAAAMTHHQQQPVRLYQGEAKASPPPVLSEHEQALLDKARPKADAIRQRHLALPDLDQIPAHSLVGDEKALDIRRKRLVYRSKQRGWLEVDLLLGTWASQHVHTLDPAALDEYEAFVNQETIDIYNIITLRVTQEHMPDELQNNTVVKQIQEWARSNPLGKADPQTYKDVKQKAQLI